MNSTTSYFKSQMSYITSITAETFLIAALLSFIFAIAAFVSDIFIGLILMVSGLSSYISQEVLLCFFFFFKFCDFCFICLCHGFVTLLLVFHTLCAFSTQIWECFYLWFDWPISSLTGCHSAQSSVFSHFPAVSASITRSSASLHMPFLHCFSQTASNFLLFFLVFFFFFKWALLRKFPCLSAPPVLARWVDI